MVIGSIFLANGLILAWTPPSAAPPDNNVSSPLNVGLDSQTKSGALQVGSLGVDGAFKAYSGITIDGFDETCTALETDADGDLVCGTDDVGSLDLNGWSFGNDYFYDDGEQVIRATDEWLRLNQAGDFTSGVYTPGLIRADGGFQVDGTTAINSSNRYHYAYYSGEYDKFGKVNSSGFGIDADNTGDWDFLVYENNIYLQYSNTSGRTYIGGDIRDYNDDTVNIGENLVVADYVGIGVTDPDYPLHVESNSSYAIYAKTTTSNDDYAIYGEAYDDIGIYGRAVGDDFGVYGRAADDYGVYGVAADYYGVYGRSGDRYGVRGVSTNYYGVYGSSKYYGVYGYASTDYGVRGECGGTNCYGFYSSDRLYVGRDAGIGGSNPWPGSYKLYVNGNVYVKGTYSSPYCDIAELYEPSQESDELEPGDIVILDEMEEMKIKKSDSPYSPYSPLVVGVVSTNPNMTMGVLEDNQDHPPVALLGRVPTKVTTENGPIKIGDYIVSSSKPGYGMRCEDFTQCQGAIIGKALQKLESGEGIVEVLIDKM